MSLICRVSAVEYEVSVDGVNWIDIVPFNTNTEIVEHYGYSDKANRRNHYDGDPGTTVNLCPAKEHREKCKRNVPCDCNILYLIHAGDDNAATQPRGLFLVQVMNAEPNTDGTDARNSAAFEFAYEEKCPAGTVSQSPSLTIQDVLEGAYPDIGGSFSDPWNSPSFCQGDFGQCTNDPVAGPGPIVFMEDRVPDKEPNFDSLEDLKYNDDGKILIGSADYTSGLTWTSATDGFVMRLNAAAEFATLRIKYRGFNDNADEGYKGENGPVSIVSATEYSDTVGSVIANTKPFGLNLHPRSATIYLRTKEACQCEELPPSDARIVDGKVFVCHKAFNVENIPGPHGKQTKPPLMVRVFTCDWKVSYLHICIYVFMYI